jgi:hypothetical protein
MLATSTLPDHPAHSVQFFDTDEQLVDGVTGFVRRALETDCTCILVATSAHREAIDSRLEARGLSPAAYAAAYRYISLDAEQTMGGFMEESGPDPQRFHQSFGLLLRQASARGQPVHVVGEMASMLIARGRMRDALRLEELGNELGRYHTFTLLCVYQSTPFENDERRRAQVCALHTHVISEP